MTPRTTLRRTACVLAVTTGLLLAGLAPASADRLNRSDPRGDVVSYSNEVRKPLPRVEAYEPRPGRRIGDIIRTIVKHKAEKVVLKTRYARLNRKHGHSFEAVWLLLDNTDNLTQVYVEAGPGGYGGQLTVFSSAPTPARVLLDCGRHRISYKNDFVKVVLPRSCLDFPTWFRVVTYTQFFLALLAFADDGLQTGFSGTLNVSRRLFSG